MLSTPLKSFRNKSLTRGKSIKAINAPTIKGEIRLRIEPIRCMVWLKVPINLYIRIVPTTNNSAYITIVEYLLFGMKKR